MNEEYKEMDLLPIFSLFEKFCEEKGYKLWMSQYAYGIDLFRTQMCKGLDRSTGKTIFSILLMAFNEKYKLWKILYTTDTIESAQRIKQDVRDITGQKLTECRIRGDGQLINIEYSMAIDDHHSLMITIINREKEIEFLSNLDDFAANTKTKIESTHHKCRLCGENAAYKSPDKYNNETLYICVFCKWLLHDVKNERLLLLSNEDMT